jgi:hypothetical protein
VRENSFEGILVNHCGYCPFEPFAQAAHNPSGTIHEDVGICAQDRGRQHNAKLDDGTNGDIRIHVEQNPAGGNIGGFSEMLVSVACSNGNGKLQGESYGISEIRQHCVFTHTHALYTDIEAAQSYFGILGNTEGHAQKSN